MNTDYTDQKISGKIVSNSETVTSILSPSSQGAVQTAPSLWRLRMSELDDVQKALEKVLGKEAAKGPFGSGFSDRREILTVGEANFVPSATKAATAAEREVTVNQPSHSSEILKTTIMWEYIYAMLGLVLGLSCVLGGIVLGLHGVAGNTSWTAKVLGLSSTVNDATPGVVLFIVGIFMVFITRPKVKLGKLNG
jgi:hypothetical protein